MIKDLVVYEEVQHPLMTGLINLLKPAEKEEKEGDSSRQTSSGEVEQVSSDHVIEQLCVVSLSPSKYLYRCTSSKRVQPRSLECWLSPIPW